MRAPSPTLRLAAVWLLLLGAAAGAAWWNVARERRDLRERLIDRAERCAVAFVTDDVAALTGTRADLETAGYRAVKDRLRRLREVTPGIRFVYLFRSTDEPGRVVFLADSEPTGSADESLPGDDYPEALASPGLQAILADFRPATEGPLRDSFGEWVTAYAPVGDRPPPGAARVVLGLDMNAAEWSARLRLVGLVTGALVFVVLALPYSAWLLLRRERRFHREIRRLSTAIQQSHSAVLITDTARTIEYVNDGCVAMTGYTAAELLGQPSRILLPDETAEEWRAGLLGQLLAGERWQGETLLRRRNGECFPVRALFSPVRSESGEVTALVAVFDDISAAKKVEAELRLARDQAQSADRAKGEFLAVMSHELRTPLNGIIGFATLLEDTPLSAEQLDSVQTIRKSGEALLALTNELLDYSRLDAGRMELDLQPCAPRQVVEEAVELLSARAAEKNLELLVAVAAEVPAHVRADPGRLRQVLVNLLSNAIKFTPSGEVEVTVTARPADGHARARLEFTVRDTGIGIASEKQDRLFQPFSQVDASSTRKYGGAGLGLAISRSLVRLMNGDIEVSSAAGAGSQFRFHVVVELIEAAARLAALPAARVALVSPNSRARAHYVGLLGSWGLQATGYVNVAALPPRREHAVVVVDVLARDAALWPGVLREHAALAGGPVIGLVPVSVPGALRDELRASFRALLKKPVREPLLHTVLASVLKP